MAASQAAGQGDLGAGDGGEARFAAGRRLCLGSPACRAAGGAGIASFRKGFGIGRVDAGRGGAGRWSSSRNGDGPAASARTHGLVAARVMRDVEDAPLLLDVVGERGGASARRAAPNTTTYGHSMPFTRWTVARCTPASRGRRPAPAPARCAARLERGGVGVERRDLRSSAVRSSRWLDGREPLPTGRGCPCAAPRPIVVADARSRSAVVAPAWPAPGRALRGRRRRPSTRSASFTKASLSASHAARRRIGAATSRRLGPACRSTLRRRSCGTARRTRGRARRPGLMPVGSAAMRR